MKVCENHYINQKIFGYGSLFCPLKLHFLTLKMLAFSVNVINLIVRTLSFGKSLKICGFRVKTRLNTLQSYAAGQVYKSLILSNAQQCPAMVSNAQQCPAAQQSSAMLRNAQQCSNLPNWGKRRPEGQKSFLELPRTTSGS